VTERFMVVPFSNGLWKILDLKVGRYTRAYDDERSANRYARRRNGSTGRTYRRCGDCDSAPCECRGSEKRK